MYKPNSLTEQQAEALEITPDKAEALGRTSVKILDNPFKGEGLLARRWVDGWQAAFIERIDKGDISE
jgi:hypothetical protein